MVLEKVMPSSTHPLLKACGLNLNPNGSSRPHVDQLRVCRDPLTVYRHPAEVVRVFPAKRLQVRLEEEQSALDSNQSLVFTGREVFGGGLKAVHARDEELVALAEVGRVQDLDGLHRYVGVLRAQRDSPQLKNITYLMEKRHKGHILGKLEDEIL